MTDSNIPSEIDFWTKHVEALETCSICLEPFSEAHSALRFTGQDACSHVFGHPCLRNWTGTANHNANKCPVCRRVLWKSDDPDHVTNTADQTHDDDPHDDDPDADELSEDLQWESDGEYEAFIEDLMARLEDVVSEPDEDGDDDEDSLSSDDESSISSIDGDLEDLQAEYYRLSDEMMARMLDAALEPDEYDEDEDDEDEDDEDEDDEDDEDEDDEDEDDEDEDHENDGDIEEDPDTNNRYTPTISLKYVDSEIIDELLDALYNDTAPTYAMPADAGMSHMRERMEYCIDSTLKEAGYTEPFQVAPGLLDNMLLHFRTMVIHRRNYAVGGAYLRWWKDVMLTTII
jgi:hypothetical protein